MAPSSGLCRVVPVLSVTRRTAVGRVAAGPGMDGDVLPEVVSVVAHGPEVAGEADVV